MNDRTCVAVGVILNPAQDAVLISRRNQHQHLAGYWEFPGGKIDSGENVEQALQRELLEELDIAVNDSIPFMQIKYDYPDKKVLLDVRKVIDWEGQAVGRENQEIAWVSLSNLHYYLFPPANLNIVMKLSLPPVYLISKPSYESINELISVVKDCQQNGLQIFQLRVTDNNKNKLQEIIKKIRELDIDNKISVILNSRAEDIGHYDVAGIHLKSSQLYDYSERPLSTNLLLGASCHSKQEIEQAQRLNVDYMFISPVKKTRTHPDAEPIGWNEFETLCRYSDKPVYALGGMLATDLVKAKEHGAIGIAMIDCVWRSSSPGQVIKSMLNS